ncbi:serine dehydratase [Erysipelothrix larvae]|uniref:L-serine dehydratase n=1 Tax=Erysipelothrix larvae TaxID=1514105 RepID=A0A0X8GZ02_9FIRM|nr:L-serine ammonia-lyase, iron-sulfur-dependent, subunit alpha [Erysipelothrix larvae]AMC92849.1 serine dehydratase [Erysipelothrix larvae]
MDSIKALIEAAKDYESLAECAIDYEVQNSGMTKEQVLNKMKYQLDTMKRTVDQGVNGVRSKTGLTGMDAKKLHEYINTKDTLCDTTILNAVQNAIATNEVNAAMGLICATPTAGSAGVVPGVLTSLHERFNMSEKEQLDFLFVSAIFGYIIANNASISGAMGGCQAEIGSASAMASAACVCYRGGTPEMAAHALAITIKNLLGLVCDPVAGLVEVPCVKRNALGASLALVSADMALAGIKSKIDPDEVIETMYRVGQQMDASLKETGQGGLATTPSGLKYTEEIFGGNREGL